jgi:hypothetical protein
MFLDKEICPRRIFVVSVKEPNKKLLILHTNLTFLLYSVHNFQLLRAYD